MRRIGGAVVAGVLLAALGLQACSSGGTKQTGTAWFGDRRHPPDG